MRIAAAIIISAVTASAFAQQKAFQLHAVVSARAIYVKSQPSWTQGAFGRFDVGAKNANDARTVNVDVAQLGFDWTPTSWLLLHADGLARKEPSGTEGSRAGIVQAFADLYTEHLRLRVGSFWLPTSRENVDPLWNSPYTITYSALNTWIGQEVRPVGADVQFSPNFYFTVGGTAFKGNDTMGTLIADRGWTFGNRLTVYNENVAVPPPDGLTKPIGRDIDGKVGFSERIRFQLPERLMLQVAHIDNRAKVEPGDPPEVPWSTKFNVISFDAGQSAPTTIAAEWAKGETTLGFPGGSFTMDFSTVYLLVCRKSGPNRFTTRVERFSTRDHSRAPDDHNRESGKAYTVAWLHDVNEHFRTGLEYVRVDGDRAGAAAVGLDTRASGSTITVEVRYRF
jgi:opacity protein-like surface antigen